MNDDFEVTRGEGNVFRDFGYADADAEHLKAVLAAQIIKVLDARRMTVRNAEGATGIAAADFSRIRRAKLDRFTIDRLMAILGRLDQKVEIEVTVRAKKARVSSAQSTRRSRPDRNTDRESLSRHPDTLGARGHRRAAPRRCRP